MKSDYRLQLLPAKPNRRLSSDVSEEKRPFFKKNYDFFKKSLDKLLSVVYNVTVIWVWRRLVARYLGVVEAAGSSPVTQTKEKPLNR